MTPSLTLLYSPGDIVQKTAFLDVFLEQAEKLSLGVKKYKYISEQN